MLVKDSMVIIHLAKITLLEKSCEYFKKVIIPQKVYEEIVAGKGKFAEVRIIEEMINSKKIMLKTVKNTNLLKKTSEFNLQEGEAEAVALYWQEKAQYLATDDDNVRGKKELLDLNLIGTPAIILKLFKDKKIDAKKAKQSAEKLRKIGWFSSEVIDRIIMEVENDG